MTHEQDLNELRRIAEQATPGPWTHQPYGGQNQNGDYTGGWLLDADGEWVVADVSDRDGAHMAAFNPRTAIALLDRVEAAEQVLQRVRDTHRMRTVLGVDTYGSEYKYVLCTQCHSAFPCPTIRALDGGEQK